MQEYAGICIGAYFAYFAYVCTPHFADGTCPVLDLWTSGMFKHQFAAENDVDWALKDIPGIS